MSVRRIFVEKREAFAVKAKELREEIVNYLGIQTITGVRVLIRYDIENVSDAVYQELWLRFFPSLRWTTCMRRASRQRREIWYLQ